MMAMYYYIGTIIVFHPGQVISTRVAAIKIRWYAFIKGVVVTGVKDGVPD